jgi:hypothetical protein
MDVNLLEEEAREHGYNGKRPKNYNAITKPGKRN